MLSGQQTSNVAGAVMGAFNPAPAGARSPEISGEVEALERVVGTLEDRIKSLYVRLQPVLSPVAVDQAKSGSAPKNSPLGATIGVLVARIVEVNRAVEQIYDAAQV